MVRFIRSSVALAVLAGCALCAARAGGQKGKDKLTADEEKVLELTNAKRKEKKLRPLKLNPLLVKLARAHSANMARQGKLEHTLDGKGTEQRLKDAGYKYLGWGENIYLGKVGFGTPEHAVKYWMKSKFHRENILDPNFSETGVGMARDKQGEIYYTQVFGAPG